MRGEPYAVGTVFALNGALFGSWVARIPDAADRTSSSPAVLGLAFLCIAAGAVVAMPLAGRLCARVDSRAVVGVAITANCLALPLLALAGSPLTLAGGLAVYGVTTGATDVSMNTNAVAAVRNAGRPLMPVFHGGFSAGGMVGAAAGGIAAGHLEMPTHFALAAALGQLIGAVVYRHLPVDRPAAAPPAGPRRSSGGQPARIHHFDSTILILGAVAFCCALGEGAVGDWSALFMRDVLHTGATLAAAGFTAFSVTMALARFSGAAVISRIGPASTLVGGCALAVVGAAAVVTAPVAGLALAGFAAIGAGLACGFPIALNAAGAHPSGSGPAIGLVTTIGYAGFLVGPPAIGFGAQQAGLRVGLSFVGVVAALGLLLAVSRRRLLHEADPSRPGEPPRTGAGRSARAAE